MFSTITSSEMKSKNTYLSLTVAFIMNSLAQKFSISSYHLCTRRINSELGLGFYGDLQSRFFLSLLWFLTQICCPPTLVSENTSCLRDFSGSHLHTLSLPSCTWGLSKGLNQIQSHLDATPKISALSQKPFSDYLQNLLSNPLIFYLPAYWL